MAATGLDLNMDCLKRGVMHNFFWKNNLLQKTGLYWVLTALRVWVHIHTHFFLTFLSLDHTQLISVESDYLVLAMKDKSEIYNP